jgi:PAS domain S-box-containing protein
MMDDFFNLTNIGIAILDLHGKVLVATGWQDICTQFHRIHPETCKNCLESDLELSKGVEPGEFRLYQCKNNMWDMATPIIVGDKRIGNLYLGQFLFEDETLDLEVFRSQAQKYGFNEGKYLTALDRVPRWSRQTVNTVMTFYAKLAHMISELSYSNIRINQALKEQNNLFNSLRESEEKYRSLVESTQDSIYVVNRNCTYLFMNKRHLSRLEVPEDNATGKTYREFHSASDTQEFKKKVEEVFASDAPLQHEHESHRDGKYFLRTLSPVIGPDGRTEAVTVVSTDITDMVQAEQALTQSEQKFRSTFEQAAVGIAHVAPDGRWLRVNQKLCEIVGYSREELLRKTFQDITYPEDLGTDLEHVRQMLAEEIPTYSMEQKRRCGRARSASGSPEKRPMI